MKTTIHKNLHAQRDGTPSWAITQKGLIVGYCTGATLLATDTPEDAKKALFSRSGNKRTVHLWLRGTLIDVVGYVPFKGRQVFITPLGHDHSASMMPVSYNPKRDQGFVFGSGRAYTGSAVTIFDDVMYGSTEV